ncbi:MAG: potassium channel protein [Candidatus Aminicenantes bacterium]|nr:potassium channel protein [Candidatus Aminicenantes bacterium]
MGNRKKIIASLLIFVFVFFVGVVGFKTLGGEKWSWGDSLYMTVITLSTVGYGEAVDMASNPGARIFASVFIFLCLGTIAFAISSITAFIVEGELKNILWRKKMDKEISKLKDHYIICGSDSTAQTIISELLLSRKKFVVVEPSKEKLEKLSSLGEFFLVHGDPTEDITLIAAGIERAKGILLSLPSDEENLFVTLTAKDLNPHTRVITKGIDIKSHRKMEKAGADAVISPSFIGGMRMVSEMIRPAVVSFLDTMLRDQEEVLRFEEVAVRNMPHLIGKTLSEFNSENKTGSLLVALKEGQTGKYHFSPRTESQLQENDVLILMGNPEVIASLEKNNS